MIGFIIIVFCAGTFGESFCSERLKSYFCLLSYCFCFGGFWYKEDTCDKIKACNCECCQIDCYYCFEFWTIVIVVTALCVAAAVIVVHAMIVVDVVIAFIVVEMNAPVIVNNLE